MKKKILVTGKTSRFCRFLKQNLNSDNIFYSSKKEFNILNVKNMENYVKRKKINYIIHTAGLSRPMSVHDIQISESINLNIIGTANLVKVCEKYNVKLIYFSTNYVYPGTKGNYKESSALKPVNNYAWSKLGGEASVQMYKNSLILRLSMTDYPFVHKKAISGAVSSFIFNYNVAQIVPHLLNYSGVINIGGKTRDILSFAKKFSNKKIAKINFKKVKNFPKNSSLNINKLKEILKYKPKLRKLIQ